VAAEEEPSVDAATPEDGAAPKKRTRRGSRGGRNRKRKTATPAATEGEAGALATADPEPPEPSDEPGRGDEYVPMSEWIDELEK
jgi:hypothetical protein